MQWWQERTTRERLIVAGGGILVLLSMLFLMVIEPLHTESDRLRIRIARQQADLDRVRAAAAEAERLRASGGDQAVTAAGGSLVSFLDQSLNQGGLRQYLSRLSPGSAGNVRVQFDSLPFDQLIEWLTGIATEQGVRVEEITLNRQQDQPGQVRAGVTLAR
ncbi:MAG: type II secretion system protein M [Gammaproteobacteria bacterium]|nr:type II secretion system protein M [Gammaproteobacteria bacterium]